MAVGFAVGLLTVALLNPVAGLQLYVSPVTVALPITLVGVVHVVVKSKPAFAFGVVLFCVTVVLATLVQPFAGLVTVTLYTPGVVTAFVAVVPPPLHA